MRFFDNHFPLIVLKSGAHFDEAEVQEMIVGCEKYFVRGERYALLVAHTPGGSLPGPKERKHIAEWMNSPRVREAAHRLCAGTANVVPNAIVRGVETAIHWLSPPPSPYKSVATVELGLDYCFEALERAGLALPESFNSIRAQVLSELDGSQSAMRVGR